MKRRDILKTAGASLAGGVAAAGTVGAERVDEQKPRPAEGSLARRKLTANEGLLEELAADGLVDEATPDEFALESHAASPADEDGVGVVTASVGGQEEDVLLTTREVDGGRLLVGVTEDDYGFAAYQADGETTTYHAKTPGHVDCGICQVKICIPPIVGTPLPTCYCIVDCSTCGLICPK